MKGNLQRSPAIIELGQRVYLRRPSGRDAEAFLKMVRASRELHRPWVDPPSDRDSFAAYLRHLRWPRQAGALVMRRDDNRIAGVINVNEIVRGGFESGYLGFYANAETAGQGCMTEGLHLMLHHAFSALKLHRLEANIQPDNARSIALVTRCGFRKEGLSLRYLKIGNCWRDHERWAVTLEDWRELQRRVRSSKASAVPRVQNNQQAVVEKQR